VSLADIADENQIPTTLLQALRILPDVHRNLMEQVTEALGRQGSPLLLLDNAEHLLDAVAALTLHLLEALPDMQILVTSRQRLDILGESLFPLSSLKSPTSDLPYDTLIEMPAAALFLDRAQRVRPDFILTDRSLPDFVQICRFLEGVPLALELAAARVTHQTLAGIAADLAANLLVLKSRQRGLSKRHQSLRATLQGSIDLLSPEQKEFFAALSVFQGGWTEMLLEDLLVRSLVVATENAERGTIRYAFLETIRQFATELLSEEQRSRLIAEHRAYFLALAAEVWADDIRTLPPLDDESENLPIALERGWQQQDDTFWHGLIGALCYLFFRGWNVDAQK
jgi:non-specific serine/threonine protein kinase